MLVFQYPNGNIAMPIEEYDKLQKKNLERIKYKGEHIPDLEKVSVYYPEIRFKNVVRENEDGTFDVIINDACVNAIPSGFLPKSFYNALRMRKLTKKNLLVGEKDVWEFIEVLHVSEREILGTFTSNMEISEIEHILEATIKKGVRYFG